MAINGFGVPPQRRGNMAAPAGKTGTAGGTGQGTAPARNGQEGGSKEEYPQGVSNMLKEVHGMLQKMGSGLPGFQQSAGVNQQGQGQPA